jgi:hypothetical protein
MDGGFRGHSWRRASPICSLLFAWYHLRFTLIYTHADGGPGYVYDDLYSYPSNCQVMSNLCSPASSPSVGHSPGMPGKRPNAKRWMRLHANIVKPTQKLSNAFRLPPLDCLRDPSISLFSLFSSLLPFRLLPLSKFSCIVGETHTRTITLRFGLLNPTSAYPLWQVGQEDLLMVIRYQTDQPAAASNGRGCSSGRRRSALATAGRSRARQQDHTVAADITVDLADPLDDPAPPPLTTDTHPHRSMAGRN